MKVGQEVAYIDGKGGRRIATVSAITGAGKSLNKELNLSYRDAGEDVLAEEVPHGLDAEEGQGYWVLKGESRIEDPTEDEIALVAPDLDAFPDYPDNAPPQENDDRPKKRKR